MQFVFHLRDTNLPTFVFEDAELFLGLVRDLFPGVECPHVGCTDLKAAAETSLAAEGYVVLPAQVSSNRSHFNRKLRSERVGSPFKRTSVERISKTLNSLCL